MVRAHPVQSNRAASRTGRAIQKGNEFLEPRRIQRQKNVKAKLEVGVEATQMLPGNIAYFEGHPPPPQRNIKCSVALAKLRSVGRPGASGRSSSGTMHAKSQTRRAVRNSNLRIATTAATTPAARSCVNRRASSKFETTARKSETRKTRVMPTNATGTTGSPKKKPIQRQYAIVSIRLHAAPSKPLRTASSSNKCAARTSSQPPSPNHPATIASPKQQ